MQGNLQPGSLPRLLGELLAGAESGVLRLRRDAESVAIHLREGRIAGVARSAPSTRPPAASLSGSLEKRLGSVLRDLGIEPCGQPSSPRRDLWDALSWQEGTYAFEGGAAFEAEGAALDVSIHDLIREAVRRIADASVFRKAFVDIDGRLASSRADGRLEDLTPEEAGLLSRLNGAGTIREAIESTERPPEETQRSLFCLLCLGAIEVRPEAIAPSDPVVLDDESVATEDAVFATDDEAAAIRRQEIQEAVLSLLHSDHFEVLEISRDASGPQVKEAYLRQVRRFHPDRHAEPALADLKQQLEALLIRIGEAYEVLSHPRRRARYEEELAAQAAHPGSEAPGPPVSPGPLQAVADEVENTLLAEDAIRRADLHMIESRYWDAIQVLEAVIPWIQSTKLKHAAQVRLARAYTKNPHWVRRGEDLLQSVVREDPSRSDAYFVLGTIYRENGLRNRAMTMFRKVLDLKPHHGQAAAEIRSLEHGAPAKRQLGRA